MSYSLLTSGIKSVFVSCFRVKASVPVTVMLQLSPVIAEKIVSAGCAKIHEVPWLASPVYNYISFHTVAFLHKAKLIFKNKTVYWKNRVQTLSIPELNTTECFPISLHIPVFLNHSWYQSSFFSVFQQNYCIRILFHGIQVVQLQAFYCIGL